MGCTENSGDNRDLKFQWIDISCGTFTMGSSVGKEWDSPPHQITISKGFQIGKYEVTQAQWKAVMDSNPSLNSGRSNPVEQITWNECQTFISKLNEIDSAYTYRLPTEAEWEYCCRAGSDTKFCSGNEEMNLGDYAWFHNNSYSKTHPIGQKNPNSWGIYDMHGNVLEWCQDWYDHDYYDNSPNIDPQGPSSGSERVYRGGSCAVSAKGCESAYRGSNPPYYGDWYHGVRLVRTSS